MRYNVKTYPKIGNVFSLPAMSSGFLNVHVVVVTFNRLAYLQQLLPDILEQSAPVSQIIIVNNSSTDGTQEWLDARNDLTVIHQENTGCSGGFATGVAAAVKAGADWVWLMDDDVLPAKDCLEKLLSYSAVSGCLHPIHRLPDGTIQEEEVWFDANTCSRILFQNRSLKGGKAVWFRNTGSFEGMLIAKHVIEKIGYPDQRFFLAHDDLAYGWLASRVTNVAVVADAVLHKQDVKKKPESALAFEWYYMHRNLWLLKEYAEKEMPGFTAYRNRRIRLHFLYTAYKLFFVDKPKHKRKAFALLRQAYRDYKQKKAGPKDG